MKMQEIRKIAKERGLRPDSRISKIELVRMIQRSEGYNDCFATELVKTCGQMKCLWREDCLSIQKIK
jgi:hypothetical protein